MHPSFKPHQCLPKGMWKRMAWLPCCLPSSWTNVTPEVNLRVCTICMPPPHVTRLATVALKPEDHQKSKTGNPKILGMASSG